MPRRQPNLIFLKIGGSVLGDKHRASSFRTRAVERIGREIANFLEANPKARILLGHGGGPMAHAPASQYKTRQGIPGGGGWEGYAATRLGVIQTNLRVVSALKRGGLDVHLVPPSAGCSARSGKIAEWNIGTIQQLLKAGQVPLIHGDAVLDAKLGFTILSTEELFAFLAPPLKPARMVFACDVDGVLDADSSVIKTIDHHKIPIFQAGPASTLRHDVTGGMASKVSSLAAIARSFSITSCIISGLRKGAVRSALEGDCIGTLIK